MGRLTKTGFGNTFRVPFAKGYERDVYKDNGEA